MSSGSMATSTPLPGQSSPFFTITDTDQSGAIVLTACFCIVVAALSVLMLIYVRFEVNVRNFAWDDVTRAASMLLCVIQGALVAQEACLGLGSTIQGLTVQHVEKIERAMYSDDILYILIIWLSKVSSSFLMLRLSPRAVDRRSNCGALLCSTATGVVVVFLLALKCDLGQPWKILYIEGSKCFSSVTRWRTVAAVDIATEIVLAVPAVILIRPLQMSVSRKAVTIASFAVRLGLIVFIVLHLHSLTSAFYSSDLTLDITTAVLFKQIHVGAAIALANLPCLMPFLRATATYYGGGPGPEATAHTSGHNSFSRSSRARNGSYMLRNLGSDSATGQKGISTFRTSTILGGYKNVTNNAEAIGYRHERNRDSFDSQQRIIKVQKQVDVAFEEGASQESYRTIAIAHSN